MPKYKSKNEVKIAAKEILVDAGISEDSADYLADLYSSSERGKSNVEGEAGEISPAASCSTGIIPIL